MIIRYLLIAISINIVCSLGVQADTHVATSCASSAIQTAINGAADGDIVSVPVCASDSWSGDVTIPDTKGITLQGAGSSSTIITLNGNTLNLETSSSNKPSRITGFRFKHTNTEPAVSITGSAKNWRIDNNIFDDNGISGAYTIQVGADPNVDSFTYGLIDHNQFINRNYATSIIVRWPRGSLDSAAAGDWIWSQPAQRGTAQAVYIEDNIFSGTGKASQVVDITWGAKYVLRYNTIHNPWISTHSGCTNGYRDPLWVEIYKNRFTDDGNRYGGSQIEMRSVSGVIWGNTSSATLGTYVSSIDHERSYRTDCNVSNSKYNARCDGTRAWDENLGLHGYRCLGQPGWGAPQASDMRAYTFAGVFNWGNLNNNVPIDMIIVNDNGYTSEHLKAGRELFNASDMAIGPIASRPSTCSVGPPRSVYVSTDENAIGAAIYICTAQNVWTKHYEPYTYPHPIISGQSEIDSPKNLRITN